MVTEHHQALLPSQGAQKWTLLGPYAVSCQKGPVPWFWHFLERSGIGIQKHKSDLMAPLLKTFCWLSIFLRIKPNLLGIWPRPISLRASPATHPLATATQPTFLCLGHAKPFPTSKAILCDESFALKPSSNLSLLQSRSLFKVPLLGDAFPLALWL